MRASRAGRTGRSWYGSYKARYLDAATGEWTRYDVTNKAAAKKSLRQLVKDGRATSAELVADDGEVIFHVGATVPSPAQPSLAERTRAAGHEPETEEGGRAMMQSITMEDIFRGEAARKLRTLKPGDEIKYTNFTVGGSFKGTAIVTWDHGKSVEARTLGGEHIRLERASDGSLRRFT